MGSPKSNQGGFGFVTSERKKKVAGLVIGALSFQPTSQGINRKSQLPFLSRKVHDM
jgi:hypothetical protein